MIAIDALGATGQRQRVGIADELDDDVLLVRAGSARPSRTCSTNFPGHVDSFRVKVQRRDQVLNPRATRVAFDVAQLAHGFHAADFDGLDFVLDEHFFQGRFLAHFVVPDLNLDAAIERAPGCGQVRSARLSIALPIE